MGFYQGSACNWNLKYQIPDQVPIFFTTKLAMMLIHQGAGEMFFNKHIGVIAETKDKYIAFNVKINVNLSKVTNEDGKEVCKNIEVRFIDSCTFMA